MFRHLLVPIDGSSLSDGAVRKAVSFAGEADAKITFFYATPDTGSSIYGEEELLRTIDPQEYQARRAQIAREVLERAAKVAADGRVDAQVRSRPAQEPWEAIIATAEECGCDLILMASHGHRGIKGLLLGSQTQKVLLHSKFPVLVYR
ncbi:universal stress protein [Aromatoleum toluclasticum]|uniref:universal stress protein n=1 Tax=Aromatoleum toluclasticum TaxID=92003 RepID=UPI00036EA013|nr:universal stress protein [Aromatoleum toluclasticum]